MVVRKGRIACVLLNLSGLLLTPEIFAFVAFDIGFFLEKKYRPYRSRAAVQGYRVGDCSPKKILFKFSNIGSNCIYVHAVNDKAYKVIQLLVINDYNPTKNIQNKEYEYVRT